MKCTECINESKTSKVYMGEGSITAMGLTQYYDEDGVFHTHNPNWLTAAYNCSNGHKWISRTQAQCGVDGCDFGKAFSKTRTTK